MGCSAILHGYHSVYYILAIFSIYSIIKIQFHTTNSEMHQKNPVYFPVTRYTFLICSLLKYKPEANVKYVESFLVT